MDIALVELHQVVAELITALDQTTIRASKKENSVDSQLCLLRIISQCLENTTQYYHDDISSAHRLDDQGVLRALSVYTKMMVSYNGALEGMFGDLSVTTRPSQSSRPTSQLLSRRTDESSHNPSVVQYQEMQHHWYLLSQFVSRSNWPATFDLLCTLLRQPYVADEEHDYNKKIRFLSYLEVSVASIDPLLTLVHDTFDTLLKYSQLEVIKSLHNTVCRWIVNCPAEIATLRQGVCSGRLVGGARLFDTLYAHSFGGAGRTRTAAWPLLGILCILCLHEPASGPNSTKHGKRDTFFAALKNSWTSKASVCLEAYAHILYIISYLSPSDRASYQSTLMDVYTSISSCTTVLRNCVEKGLFSAPMLFQTFFRLDMDEYADLAMLKLDLWLHESETSPLKVQAVQCVAAIFADNTLRMAGPRMDKLLRVASGRIKIPYLAPSLIEDHNLEADLSKYVLDMFCTAPEVILAHQDHAHALDSALVSCLAQDDLSVTSTAGKLILELQSPQCMHGRIFGRKLHEDSSSFFPSWSRFSVESMKGIIDRLMKLEPVEVDQTIILLELLTSCGRQRILTLRQSHDQLGGSEDVVAHTTIQESLEVVLLFLLCHVDFLVATRAAVACNLLVEEAEVYRSCRLTSPWPMSPNLELYSHIAGETFLTAGRNAVQKKIRNRLCSARHTPVLRKAWFEVYERWSKLTDRLFDAKTKCISAQEGQLEWQNYTGFLTALARLDKADREDPIYTFISRFQEVFIQSRTEFISEVCAEIIGNALHISLYTPVLEEIQKMIVTMKDRKGVLIVRSRNTILMEQIILICRGLFERLPSFLTFREGVNVGEMMLDLAQYLELCGQTYIRSRLRFCQLCEVFATRFDLMCILGETSVRRRLCNYLGNWVALSETTTQDLDKIVRDTNAACLRALAQLSNDLQFGPENVSLRRQITQDIKSLNQVVLPLSSMTEDEENRFSSAPLRPILIELLSNVLAANRSSAVSSFISLCNHESVNVGTLFTMTISNQIKSDGGYHRSYSALQVEDQLCSLMTKDASLMTAFLDGCPLQDSPVESLLDLYQDLDRPADLFSLVLDTEISICDQVTELFRRNCPATRLFAAYVKRYGSDYAHKTLQKPLLNLENRAEKYNMELDRGKLDCSDPASCNKMLAQNQANLLSTCQEFIDAICQSMENLPLYVKKYLVNPCIC